MVVDLLQVDPLVVGDVLDRMAVCSWFQLVVVSTQLMVLVDGCLAFVAA